MTARATEITDALLARLSAVPGFAVSYGPPRGGVQAGYLYLIAESDAQARSDDARQPNARLRERSYRVEVYLARGARYLFWTTWVHSGALSAVALWGLIRSKRSLRLFEAGDFGDVV